jgi:hypothetical protein
VGGEGSRRGVGGGARKEGGEGCAGGGGGGGGVYGGLEWEDAGKSGGTGARNRSALWRGGRGEGRWNRLEGRGCGGG